MLQRSARVSLQMAAKTLRVLVGSTNKAKIEAARFTFAAAFSPLAASIDVTSVSAPSHVPDQPLTDADTRTGAFNRAHNAMKLYRQQHPSTAIDFSVGMEGGCMEDSIRVPTAAMGAYAAPEATSVASSGQYTDLSCFAWMAVLHVPTGRWGFARTASFSVPPAVASLVRQGMELGQADDRIFGRTGSGAADGTVGILSHGAITRSQYYQHALYLALLPFLHDPPGAVGSLHLPLGAPHGSGSPGGHSAAVGSGDGYKPGRAPLGVYEGHVASS